VLVAARPEVPLRRWWRATIAGALVGWGLGSLPSLFLAGQGAGPEPPRTLVLLGAAALGIAAGPILGAFQARVLKGIGVSARRWVVANALGWMLAMPLVFAAADRAWTALPTIARGAVFLGLAGALAGVSTGLALTMAQGRDRRVARGEPVRA
jgi:hypothetical protein